MRAVFLVSYVIIALILLKSIAKSISYIENKAKDIIDGNSNDDIKINMNKKEIKSLTNTINKLSSDLRELSGYDENVINIKKENKNRLIHLG